MGSCFFIEEYGVHESTTSTPFIEHNRDLGRISITCVEKVHTLTGTGTVKQEDHKDTPPGQIVKPTDIIAACINRLSDSSLNILSFSKHFFIFFFSQGATLMLKLLVAFTGKISLHMLPKASFQSAGIFDSFDPCLHKWMSLVQNIHCCCWWPFFYYTRFFLKKNSVY